MIDDKHGVEKVPYVTWDRRVKKWLVFLPVVVDGKVKKKVFRGRESEHDDAKEMFEKGMRELYGERMAKEIIATRRVNRESAFEEAKSMVQTPVQTPSEDDPVDLIEDLVSEERDLPPEEMSEIREIEKLYEERDLQEDPTGFLRRYLGDGQTPSEVKGKENDNDLE